MTQVDPDQPLERALNPAPDWARVDRALRRFIRAQGLAPADADDVLQDALLRVLNGLDRLRSPDKFDAFVFQTTRFAIADHFRRGPRDRPEPDVAELLVAAPEAPATDGDEERARRVLAAWLKVEIESLPEPVQSTLRKTEIEGHSHKTLADAEGVTVSAIKSRVSRGRRTLKRRLQRCCEVQLDARQRVTDFSARSCACDSTE